MARTGRALASFKNSWKSLLVLPRSVWTLALACFVNRLGNMCLPYLTLFVTQELGAPASTAGNVLAAYGIVSLLVVPIAGKLSDTLGSILILRFSLISSGILLLFFPFFRSVNLLMIMVSLLSFVGEPFRPALFAAVSQLTPPEQRRAAFVLTRAATNIGMSAGPAIGGFLILSSFNLIFVVNGLMTLITASVLFQISNTRLPHPSKVDENSTEHFSLVGGKEGPQLFYAITDLRYVYFLLATLPVIMVFFQYDSSMPIYLTRDMKLPHWVYGLMFTFSTATIAIFEIPISFATAEWELKRTLCLACVLIAVGFGGLALASNIWIVFFAATVWTVGEMLLFPSLNTYVVEIAPKHRVGEYMGLFTMIFSLGFAVGPLIGTRLLEKFGGSFLWGVCLIVGLFSALLMMQLRSSKGRDQIA